MLPLLSGCSLVQSVVTSTAERPSLEFKNVAFPRIDLDGADINLVFQVTNPNSVGLDLAQADYAVDIEGHRLVGGKPQGGLKIPARGSSEVTLPVSVHWKDLAPAVETLFSKDKIAYKVGGTFGLSSPVGPVSLPIEHQGTFDAPRLPKIDLEAPQIASLSLKAARLVLPLKVENPNSFPLAFSGVEAAVQISNVNVGQIALQQADAISPGQEKPLQIPIDINLLSTGPAVARAIEAQAADVKIDGSLHIGGTAVPLSLDKTVALKRPSESAER